LQDLNPALLTTIDTEFDKVASETAPEPTRFSTDFAAPAPAAVGGKGKAAAAGAVADPLEDLFPRVDLDKLVPSAVVSAVGDTNWKARKEALETIQSLLEANKRLKPNFGAYRRFLC
jgi:cytoskeleton-associated protein 5